MIKLSAWIIAGACVAAGGVSTAQDRYYVQTGAYPTIGDISAAGFFQTSGVGTDTVTGFDLTLRDGSQSVTLCTSVLFGCGTPNDAVTIQVGIVDTGTHLACTPTSYAHSGPNLCLLGDTGDTKYPYPQNSLFSFSANDPNVFETLYRIGGPAGKTAIAISPPGGFVIAGANPAQAPEIDRAFAASGLMLFLGGLAVLRGRKQDRRIAA